MNLVLDFGNTCIKAALFENSRLKEKKTFSSAEELLAALPLYRQAANCIIGSVTGQHEKFLSEHDLNCEPLLFSAATPTPVRNLYQSAQTLGSDRLAAAVGAHSLYPGQNVLTIDAGTCIKYNFVNEADEFIGGAISPGIEMRLRALQYYTDKLPLIDADLNYEKLTGTNTRESILSGVMLGAAAEAEEMINRYLLLYPSLVTIISGGNGPYLCKQVKNRIFAHPDIVLAGLNSILNYNLEK